MARATAIITLLPTVEVIRRFNMEYTKFVQAIEVFASRPAYKNGNLQGNAWVFTIVGREYLVTDRELNKAGITPNYKVTL